jgi:hypothetical protein
LKGSDGHTKFVPTQEIRSRSLESHRFEIKSKPSDAPDALFDFSHHNPMHVVFTVSDPGSAHCTGASECDKICKGQHSLIKKNSRASNPKSAPPLPGLTASAFLKRDRSTVHCGRRWKPPPKHAVMLRGFKLISAGCRSIQRRENCKSGLVPEGVNRRKNAMG